MIKVLLWDIDGTLLDFIAAEAAGIRSCFRIFELGDCSDEMIRDYSAINDSYWKKLELGEVTRPQVLVGRFRDFLEKYGLDSSKAEAINQEYQIRLGDTICFYDNALETIKALKGRILQCAVTNGTRVAQTRKLKLSGMDQIFDHIFISEDIGIEKPGKGFFDAIFNIIGQYDPAQVMIIGDSLTSDMKGGVNAGIRTCWFNPKGLDNNKGLHLDHEIRNIAEVMDILEIPG